MEVVTGRSRRGFRLCSFPSAVIAPCSHFLPPLGHMLHLAARPETRSGNTRRAQPSLNKQPQAIFFFRLGFFIVALSSDGAVLVQLTGEKVPLSTNVSSLVVSHARLVTFARGRKPGVQKLHNWQRQESTQVCGPPTHKQPRCTFFLHEAT